MDIKILPGRERHITNYFTYAELYKRLDFNYLKPTGLKTL